MKGMANRQKRVVAPRKPYVPPKPVPGPEARKPGSRPQPRKPGE
ncbi:MAG TPA: hypothetical protein VGH97_01280 [Thermoanaerobaculia bacterium]|jgi:hypothetical protein